MDRCRPGQSRISSQVSGMESPQHRSANDRTNRSRRDMCPLPRFLGGVVQRAVQLWNYLVVLSWLGTLTPPKNVKSFEFLKGVALGAGRVFVLNESRTLLGPGAAVIRSNQPSQKPTLH